MTEAGRRRGREAERFVDLALGEALGFEKSDTLGQGRAADRLVAQEGDGGLHHVRARSGHSGGMLDVSQRLGVAGAHWSADAQVSM
jgi:hypothetical protein